MLKQNNALLGTSQQVNRFQNRSSISFFNLYLFEGGFTESDALFHTSAHSHLEAVQVLHQNRLIRWPLSRRVGFMVLNEGGASRFTLPLGLSTT